MSVPTGPGRRTPGGRDVDDAPGLWVSLGTAPRLILGWFCVTVGVLGLLVDADAEPDAAYVLFHTMLIAGGGVLPALGRLGAGAGMPGHVAGASVLAGGMVIGGLAANDTGCCMTAYAVRHGYPFPFVARDDGVGDPGRWHVDGVHLLADLLFWGYAGLVLLVVVAFVRRLLPSGGTGGSGAAEGSGVADGGTVGPVP